MKKQEIHQHFIRHLQSELNTATEAAKATIATATSEEHQAKSKYDTFSLESSYLARGQARRVDELREAVERLEALPLRAFHNQSSIQLGALVRMEAGDGQTQTLFFGPAGGGETLDLDGEDVLMITPNSPLGRAAMGKTVGDCVQLKTGLDSQRFTIQSIE